MNKKKLFLVLVVLVVVICVVAAVLATKWPDDKSGKISVLNAQVIEAEKCRNEFGDVQAKIDKYTHCSTDSDCVILRGNMNHCGVSVNKNEIQRAEAVLNACPRNPAIITQCIQLKPGCISDRCGYL